MKDGEEVICCTVEEIKATIKKAFEAGCCFDVVKLHREEAILKEIFDNLEKNKVVITEAQFAYLVLDEKGLRIEEKG